LNRKHLRSVSAAEKVILAFCRPRSDQQVIDVAGYNNVLRSIEYSNQAFAQKIKDIIVQNLNKLIGFCVSNGKDFKSIAGVIEEVQKQQAEWDFIKSRQSGAVFYLWERESGWWVYAQSDGHVQDVQIYPNFSDIPTGLAGKLAVLQMLPKEDRNHFINHFEPGVGIKIDNNSFWIIAE
jgi:hypothetical protein